MGASLEMKFIAHRGNMGGRIIEFENFPDYIRNTLTLGFDVEVDVWYHGSTFYLGHDEPQYAVTREFLFGHRIWCHAKDLKTFATLVLDDRIHCFFHDQDDATLTSQGYIWTYPGKPVYERSIAVMPERTGNKDTSLLYCAGICSDIIDEYRKWHNEMTLLPSGE